MGLLKLLLASVFVGICFLSFINDDDTAETGLDIGNQAPVFTTQIIDGTSFDLGDLKGKMVVLNFWASYNAQSRMNNFRLTQIEDKFRQQYFHDALGLNIVNISLDRFKSPLKLAIEQDETTDFIQICDFAGTNGEIARMYNIDSPITILLDGKGRILAKDASLSKIVKSLDFLSAI